MRGRGGSVDFEVAARAFLAMSRERRRDALLSAALIWCTRGVCESRLRKTEGIARVDFYKAAALHCAAMAAEYERVMA